LPITWLLPSQISIFIIYSQYFVGSKIKVEMHVPVPYLQLWGRNNRRSIAISYLWVVVALPILQSSWLSHYTRRRIVGLVPLDFTDPAYYSVWLRWVLKTYTFHERNLISILILHTLHCIDSIPTTSRRVSFSKLISIVDSPEFNVLLNRERT
jgi:hypothetical protein